jgi:hypothetical protein
MTEPAGRPTLRSVAMPAEHGGWGLTLEPGILGVLAAPSLAGVLLGAAAVLAFLVRTPLRLVLIGRRRGRGRRRSAIGLERVRLASRVVALEMALFVLALLGAAWLAADRGWWLPAIVAAPLFAVPLWFHMRALSRHIIPEVTGSLAVAGVAAMGALAGGADMPLAIGLWVILGARILSSIPHVRAQILRIHGEPAPPMPMALGDLAALVAAIAAIWLDSRLLWGALAIVGLIVAQRVTLARPPRPAKVLGVRQMVLGFTVVGMTAVGVWVL